MDEEPLRRYEDRYGHLPRGTCACPRAVGSPVPTSLTCLCVWLSLDPAIFTRYIQRKDAHIFLQLDNFSVYEGCRSTCVFPMCCCSAARIATAATAAPSERRKRAAPPHLYLSFDSREAIHTLVHVLNGCDNSILCVYTSAWKIEELCLDSLCRLLSCVTDCHSHRGA